MKLILLKNVPKLGMRGEVVNVADGHALNYLLPQKMAEPVNAEKIAQIKFDKTRQIQNNERKAELIAQIREKIDNERLDFYLEASATGKLFAAVRASDIVKALYNKFHLNVPAKNLIIEKHIKNVGEHPVKVVFSPNCQANLIIKVISKLNGK